MLRDGPSTPQSGRIFFCFANATTEPHTPSVSQISERFVVLGNLKEISKDQEPILQIEAPVRNTDSEVVHSRSIEPMRKPYTSETYIKL